jgi:DNA adenine methylase
LVKPLYPYAGGKRRMLEFIAENTPDFGVYHEPFLGGGAVALELLRRNPDARFHLSDLNQEIVHVWESARSEPERLATLLEEHADRHTRPYFTAIRNWDRRERWEDNYAPVERAARFIYIASTAFGGMWATNDSNECVSNFGKDAFRPNLGNLLKVSRLLNKRMVNIRCASFEDTGADYAAGDFVYLDPPYATDHADYDGWDSYQSGGALGSQFQAKIKRFINSQTAKGVMVLASNASTQTTEYLYNGWNKITKRIVWTSGMRNREATEVLWGNIHLAHALTGRTAGQS